MRKIIQIAFEVYSDSEDGTISNKYALCDDGTVWCYGRHFVSDAGSAWHYEYRWEEDEDFLKLVNEWETGA